MKFNFIRGKKNHLSWSPGQVKFQSGQAYIFNVRQTSRKNTVQGYISLNAQRYLAAGQVNI